MLVLHYLALVQARDFLNPGGVVISTIGARMPLQKLAEMAEAAGYEPKLSHLLLEGADGSCRPPAGLREMAAARTGALLFLPCGPARRRVCFDQPGGSRPERICHRRKLVSKRLDAVAALEAFRRGERIGHTVAVLQASPGSDDDNAGGKEFAGSSGLRKPMSKQAGRAKTRLGKRYAKCQRRWIVLCGEPREITANPPPSFNTFLQRSPWLASRARGCLCP